MHTVVIEGGASTSDVNIWTFLPQGYTVMLETRRMFLSLSVLKLCAKICDTVAKKKSKRNLSPPPEDGAFAKCPA